MDHKTYPPPPKRISLRQAKRRNRALLTAIRNEQLRRNLLIENESLADKLYHLRADQER
jgi:hypothetical protein